MTTATDPYFIDFPRRIRDIQAAMAREGLDVYLGSRLRTLSWTLDAFCPWRSFVAIPAEGLPAAFTFVIDAARVADDVVGLQHHLAEAGRAHRRELRGQVAGQRDRVHAEVVDEAGGLRHRRLLRRA